MIYPGSVPHLSEQQHPPSTQGMMLADLNPSLGVAQAGYPQNGTGHILDKTVSVPSHNPLITTAIQFAGT